MDCPVRQHVADLHTSKRMHFIEGAKDIADMVDRVDACIRQNVCTSLRGIERRERVVAAGSCIRQNVCTSLRVPSYRD